MLKTLKKIILSSLSVLGVSLLFWILLLLNPQWSYANKTQFEFITIYHNQILQEGTDDVLNEAITRIKKSDVYHDDFSIDLCLNDDNIYPHLVPMVGQPLAYALFDKTVLKNCKVDFKANVVETEWAINNYQHRNI